jgi:hypothetical protein
MITTKIFFENEAGEKLAGYLELPIQSGTSQFCTFRTLFYL